MSLDEAIDTLTTLVGFDTVSSKSNAALIDWVATRLDDLGITSHVQHGDEPGKANLFATIGPADQPGVMLSGHSDVVPVAGENWTSDPFTLTRRGDNLYGRGSADMKGFIACFTTMAPVFARTALKTPIHLALSYNEESDMRGMRQLAAHLKSTSVLPQACVIGEPTSMRVVIANKGAAVYRCRVTGKGVHSSLRDQGISAVELAAEVIVYLNKFQKQLNQQERNDGFEFAHTSVHVGQIHGGVAHNITARDCEFILEIRALPGVRAADIIERVRQYCATELIAPLAGRFPEVSITIDEVMDAPGLDERGNRHLADAIKPLCGHSDISRVSFGTEAGILQEAGVQTVICGPGQIKVAHQADEFVEIDQLDQCLAFMQRLNQRLSQSPWS